MKLYCSAPWSCFAVAVVASSLVAGQASAQLTPYSQDFEGLNIASGSALGDDGWLVGANIFDPTGTTFLFNYFAFPAPNGSGSFSNITDSATAPVGDQGLVVFSDYNNTTEHGNGNQVNGLVFQEQLIAAGDVGLDVDFSFVAAPGDLAAPTTALAFLKTLDPNNGFATTSLSTFDTSALASGNTSTTLSLTIDPSMVGNILQFGFESTAANFVASGVNYDNVSFSSPSFIPEPGSASLIGLAAFGLSILRRRCRH